MKSLKFKYLIFFFFIINLSCEDSSTPETDEEDEIIEVSDDYNLRTVTDQGEIYSIGNKTGNLLKIGEVDRENESSILSTNTITSSDKYIYIIEYLYNPSPTNNLLIYDKELRTTRIIPLVIPDLIQGDEPAILALHFKEDKLIGVLAENAIINNSKKYIIEIDVENFSITEIGVTFTEDSITSIEKIESFLYISTWAEGFLKIDLNNKSVETLKFNNTDLNASRMALTNNSEIALMQSVEGSINGAKPILISPDNLSIIDKSNNITYGLVTLFGKTILDDDTYLNIVASESIYLGILKCNYETNENQLIEINSTSVNRNMIIVDKFN